MAHNEGRTTIASLLSAIVFFPIGLLVGALSAREGRRLSEEHAFAHQMAENPVYAPEPRGAAGFDDPAPGGDPSDWPTIEFECDLCGHPVEAAIDEPRVKCSNCNNIIDNPQY